MAHTSSISEPSSNSAHPPEVAATIIGLLGFLAYLPVGLTVLLWKAWADRNSGRFASFRSSGPGGPASWPGSSGNTAFEEYKREALERLERERRRLQDEEREFAHFLWELRRAKDREEFDRFMASRGGSSAVLGE